MEGLKELFIPSENFFSDKFNGYLNIVNSTFKINSSLFDGIGGSSSNLDSGQFLISTKWGEFQLLDMSWLDLAVSKVRPILRGFLGLMITVYNLNQLLGFFGIQSISFGSLVANNLNDRGGKNDS